MCTASYDLCHSVDSETTQLNWGKVPKDVLAKTYTAAVEARLASIPLTDLWATSCILNEYLTSIMEALVSSARDTVSSKRFAAHKKVGWNTELKTAHSKSKKAYHSWVTAGRPRDVNNPMPRTSKAAKSIFRSLQRKRQLEERPSTE